MSCDWDSTGYLAWKVQFDRDVKATREKLNGTPENAAALLADVPHEDLKNYEGVSTDYEPR